MTAGIRGRAVLLGMLCIGMSLGGCGKDKEGIVRAKMPDRFFDLVDEELPATVGVTGLAYIDLSQDASINCAHFLREAKVFEEVRLVETPYAPGCDVVVGGVLENRGDELYATFRIHKGRLPQAPLVFSIPWNPEGAGDEDVAGVYLSFNGVWSRLAIHLADNVLKISPRVS